MWVDIIISIIIIHYLLTKNTRLSLMKIAVKLWYEIVNPWQRQDYRPITALWHGLIITYILYDNNI